MRSSRLNRSVGLGLSLGLIWLTAAFGRAVSEPWVLVDTRTEILMVMAGDKPVEVFDNIALGRKGAGVKQERGDDKTPVGVFRIGWVNEHSQYNLFFGLNYPNLEYAERAYQAGRIDGLTYYTIRYAIKEGRRPPQDTLLGGSIGIHGIGGGDPWVHANFNWTHGCIALTNRDIQRLAKWVRIGTRVEIR